ncbi:hypothetical protein ACFQV2_21060 [Actinokineospora soli]|uniref:Uncharacterized protein n=1 Tax=Actinokineospora soli TaxID=1048753 RepID=A0ABW2TT08_9PSEU
MDLRRAPREELVAALAVGCCRRRGRPGGDRPGHALRGEEPTHRRLDLGAHLGKRFVVKVVDSATGGWGHIALDDVLWNAPAMPSGLSATR